MERGRGVVVDFLVGVMTASASASSLLVFDPGQQVLHGELDDMYTMCCCVAAPAMSFQGGSGQP